MRIAHVSLHMEYYPGIARARHNEARAVQELTGHTWDVYVASPHAQYAGQGVTLLDVPGEGTEGPAVGLGGLLRRLGNLNLLRARRALAAHVQRLSRAYDVVLVRYYPGDICAWVSHRLPANAVLLLHSMMVDELRLHSRLGALVERITGPLQARGALAVAGVTPEIAAREGRRLGNLPTLVLPNGVDMAATSARAQDGRRGPLKFIMAASDFRPWHGLDVVFDRLESYGGRDAFELHLAGRLSGKLARRAGALRAVHVHGLLDATALSALLAQADAGLGSFAMHRAGLAEASSIKVREYLACGLPVLSATADPALGGGFPWYGELDADWRWESALAFARVTRGANAKQVRQDAAERIGYPAIISRFIEQLQQIFPR